MDERLQQWYNDWRVLHMDTDLIYVNRDERRRVYLEQVHFVRDRIAALMWQDVKYDDVPKYECFHYDDATGQRDARPSTQSDRVRVVGEHISKSVRLPVFRIDRPGLGLRLTMRYNFHDWNVSVESEFPVEVDIAGYGGTIWPSEREKYEQNKKSRGGKTPYWGYLFFQGFPEDARFGPHSDDPRRFSLAPNDDYELYSFVRALMRWRLAR